MEKLCLDCQKPLIGRADKKFCDDQCRTNFNNRLKSKEDVVIKQINQILKRNHHILKLANPDGKRKIKREALLQKGFDFIYHTHTYQTQKGHTYFFCYDEGYLPLEGEEVLLVHQEISRHC